MRSRNEFLLAVSVVATLGLQFFSASAMPLLLGAVGDRLTLSAAAIGMLGTLELAAMAAIAAIAAPIVAVRSRVALAIGGCIVFALGQSLSAYAETLGALSVARALAGAGAGLAAAAAQASISNAANPERLFGVFFAASTPLGATLLLLLPYVLRNGAYANGYLILAGIGLLAIPLSIWLRPPLGPVAHPAGSTGVVPMSVSVLALCAIGLIGASDFGMWAFVEQIGSNAGLSAEGIGRALATATLAGSICAGLAAWIGTRFGRVFPLVVSFAVMVGAAALLGSSARPEVFSVVVNIWSVAVFVALTYTMGALATADLSGRWSAAAASARAMGGALGPFAMGLAVDRGGFPFAGLMVAGWCAIAFGLSIPLALHLARVTKVGLGRDAAHQPVNP